MAKKLKLMSLFQELSGRAAVTNRRPAPTAAGVYLMQLRSHGGNATLPRRRFMISVDLSKSPALPHPVKINHVRAGEPQLTQPAGSATQVTVTLKNSALPQVRPVRG